VDLFQGVAPLHQALDYHLERHNVLVSNISNVDTPGYVPRDLARNGVDGPAGFAGVLQVTLQRTSGAHLVGNANASPVSGRVFEDPTPGTGNDGNFVSLDREASKVAANHIRYDVISTLVAAQLGDLSFAANDGRGG
jgi:flagellar basal-body rod protein FlgB